jgi:hypothetical protein
VIIKKIKGYFKRKARAKENLIFAFRHKGVDYYQFPEYLSIPIDRLSKIAEYAKWITRGLDKKNLLELIDIADKTLYEGLSNSKNAAKIGYIIQEIRERENKCVNADIYYNYFASYYIREDEDPLIFSEQIQQEKAALFKDASGDINSFFFHLPELRELQKQSSISTSVWESIAKESMIQAQRGQSIKKILEQDSKFQSKEK